VVWEAGVVVGSWGWCWDVVVVVWEAVVAVGSGCAAGKRLRWWGGGGGKQEADVATNGPRVPDLETRGPRFPGVGYLAIISVSGKASMAQLGRALIYIPTVLGSILAHANLSLFIN
jgi:hypothetical protein